MVYLGWILGEMKKGCDIYITLEKLDSIFAVKYM